MAQDVSNRGSKPIGRLVSIVAVPPNRAVRCQQPGCGHGVYAAIHVVEEEGSFLVLGSTCFIKRYGSANALGGPTIGGTHTGGRMLTEEERQLLIDNTAALLAQFKAEAEQSKAQILDKLQNLRARLSQQQARTAALFAVRAPTQPLAPEHPWPWQKRLSSVAAFRSPYGQHWVRVQHSDGSQKLMPFPVFPDWQHALPDGIGKPDNELGGFSIGNIVAAIETLHVNGFTGPVVGDWKTVRAGLQK